MDNRTIFTLPFLYKGRRNVTLDKAPDFIREDKGHVLSAVRGSGLDLEFASPKLKCDKDVVLAAVQNDGGSIEHAAPALKNDKHVAYEAMYGKNASWMALDYVGKDILDIVYSGKGPHDDGQKALEIAIAHEKMQSTLVHKSPPMKQVAKLKI